MFTTVEHDHGIGIATWSKIEHLLFHIIERNLYSTSYRVNVLSFPFSSKGTHWVSSWLRERISRCSMLSMLGAMVSDGCKSTKRIESAYFESKAV